MSDIKEKIKEAYASVLNNPTLDTVPCCGTSNSSSAVSCCSVGGDLTGFNEDYTQLPGYNADADYGLGCGIPVTYADIEEGQTVLDLGSGAGNDAFVARALVGETGRVIGVDMTPAMIDKANQNKAKLGYTNVDFVLGDIEKLPLADATVDTVISNCVLNLVDDKLATYKEVYRVLQPNGHFSISDVVVSGPLTMKMKGVVELFAGCIAGAMQKDEYMETIKKAGFTNIEIKQQKTIYLTDDFLLQYLTQPELVEYRSTGVQVLSITVNGDR